MVDMFTPGKIGNLELKNRIIRSATWEALGDEEGRVTPALTAFIRRLAKNEVGLIILGITAIAPEGKGMYGMTGLYTDEQMESHKRMVDEVHVDGGRISVQLAHVGAQTDTDNLGGLTPVAPSDIVHPSFSTEARGLTKDEVKKLVEAFGKSAALAKKAGYDAIQIHGAHGYLVAQFMSPLFNKRDDEYGEPARFALEVYDAVRANAGGLPVFIKLNIDDFYEGSTTPEVSLPVARALDERGVDAIEVSSGMVASGKLSPSRTGIKTPDKEGYFLELARMVKKQVSCPIIGVGGYRSPKVINAALESGDVDFVAVSRALIREPGLVGRWREGDDKAARCVSCNRCFGTVKYGEGVQCMIDYRERNKKEKEGPDEA